MRHDRAMVTPADELNPVFTADGVSAWIGLPVVEVLRRVAEQQYVGFQPADSDVVLLPAFQFDEQGAGLPGLQQFIAAAGISDYDGGDIALLLIRQFPGGASAADALRNGDPHRVAERYAADLQRFLTAP